MSRKLAAFAIAVTSVLLLTGCMTAEGVAERSQTAVGRQIILDDGRSVWCIFWSTDGGDVGLSCDWEGTANVPQNR